MSRSVFPNEAPKSLSRRTVWIIVAVIVIIAVIATVAVIAASGGRSGTQGAMTATPPPPAAPTSESAHDGFSGVTVDKLNHPLQIPVNPAGNLLPQNGKTPADRNGVPDGLMWQRLYDMPLVPFSTSDGPTSIDRGIPHGWAHTPQGAALAAASILQMWIAAPEDVAQRVRSQYLSGNAADIAAASRNNTDTRKYFADQPERGPSTAVGVSISNRNAADSYVVRIAYGPVRPDESSDKVSYQVSDQPVAWVDGGWKLLVTPITAKAGPDYQDSIAGMTSWSE